MSQPGSDVLQHVSSQYRYCPQCGQQYAEEVIPRRCSSCSLSVYFNTVPVVVVLATVEQSGWGGLSSVAQRSHPRFALVLIERNIEPRGWALPSGYIRLGESLEQAAERELAEETGIKINPHLVYRMPPVSTPDCRHLLCFVQVRVAKDQIDLGWQHPEMSGVKVATEPQELVFPLHQHHANAFWRS
jgi:NADH pyrophosphatase NudC (nudix superfamily)